MPGSPYIAVMFWKQAGANEKSMKIHQVAVDSPICHFFKDAKTECI